MLKELQGEKTENNLLSRIFRIKFVQEHSQSHRSTKLLESKIKDLEELQTSHDYQNLFAFLQIKNFDDFWQKCSDKEFLVAVQQFISEEFLAIGELHFFLTKFDENTKNNVNHFLKKILADQEFNHFDNYNEICKQSVYFN